MKSFWQERGRAAKLDLYMRSTLYGLPWLLCVGVAAPLAADLVDRPGPLAMAQALAALILAECVLTMHALKRGLSHYLHGTPPHWPTACVVLLLAVGALTLTVTLQVTGGLDAGSRDGTGAVMLILYALVPATMSLYTLSTTRRLVLGTIAFVVLVGVVVRVMTHSAALAAASAVAVAMVGAFGMLTVRSTAWFISVIWELDRARDAEARLAVAEERLRFGRDLHDVMGRNLAVIALKSELAVQLARRGRPEAAEQMAEVQRIAQESQREVRDVVRGYREADLRNEIEGARGVLAAAGISCLVEDGLGTDLSAGVQSALGWVVREATTNVLRHGNPKSCSLRLTSDGVRAVLVVENDGPRSTSPVGPSGSGLAGLRERLAAVGGTLVAGAIDESTFRVTAEVPLSAPGETTTRTEKKVGSMTPMTPMTPESAGPSAATDASPDGAATRTQAGAA